MHRITARLRRGLTPAAAIAGAAFPVLLASCMPHAAPTAVSAASLAPTAVFHAQAEGLPGPALVRPATAAKTHRQHAPRTIILPRPTKVARSHPSAGSQPASTPSPTTAASARPGRTVAIGVNVAGDDNAAALSAYTKAAGRNPAIVMWFSNWAGPLYYPAQLPWADAVGATPMITWDPVNLTGQVSPGDIAAGRYDLYLDQSAALAQQYGRTLLIRFAHEMNLPSGGANGDPQEAAAFVQAWRHVVDRFAADGATNVKWVWSPNVDCGGACPFTAFYPGDAYVDYLGLDGYNFAALHSTPWQTFRQVFASSYRSITQLSARPLMIAETATSGTSSERAAWITAAFGTTIPRYFPRVIAVVWFDRVKETDWRVNFSATTLDAWRAVVADPAYQGRLDN